MLSKHTSGLGSVLDSTSLRTPLEARLSSAQPRSGIDSAWFCVVLGAQHGSMFGSNAIKVRFGSAQESDLFRLGSRLEIRLGFV